MFFLAYVNTLIHQPNANQLMWLRRYWKSVISLDILWKRKKTSDFLSYPTVVYTNMEGGDPEETKISAANAGS